MTYKEFVSRSWLKLAEDVFRAAEDGQAALHDQVLTTLIGDHYWRFQTVLAESASYAMDDVSDENVEGLKRLGDQLVGEGLDDLKELAKRLVERLFPFPFERTSDHLGLPEERGHDMISLRKPGKAAGHSAMSGAAGRADPGLSAGDAPTHPGRCPTAGCPLRRTARSW